MDVIQAEIVICASYSDCFTDYKKLYFLQLSEYISQWKMIIHFHYPKNEVFSPAVFNILKEPFIVQKETLHQQKALDLSYLDLEGQGRGIVRRAPHPHFVKSKFRFFQ